MRAQLGIQRSRLTSPGREPYLKRALPLVTEELRAVEGGLNEATVSDGVPIASAETIVVMKLLGGRTQDLADVEAIVESGADRDLLRAAVAKAAPRCAATPEKLFGNVDRSR